jgi:hypothetical protein
MAIENYVTHGISREAKVIELIVGIEVPLRKGSD